MGQMDLLATAVAEWESLLKVVLAIVIGGLLRWAELHYRAHYGRRVWEDEDEADGPVEDWREDKEREAVGAGR